MPKPLRRIPVQKRGENANLGTTINVKVGVPFFIDLQRFDPKPGSAWLQQFDSKALLFNSSGFVAQYEAAGYLWWEFTAKAAGKSEVQIVDQPHLINPLFIDRIYTIVATT